MIDSHCHLNFKAFNDDWREVANRAFLGGVDAIVNVGSDLATSKKAIEIALSPELVEGSSIKLFAAIGLHPIHVVGEKFDIADYKKLFNGYSPTNNQSLITNNKSPKAIVAIGEIGIDLYHNPNNLAAQREVFTQFITLANKHHLPVIIHNRNAGAEVLDVLSNHRPQYGGVMHFFSEDWEYAKKLFDIGLLISFTGSITLNNVDAKTIEVIKNAPLNKMMIETDAPYVVPEPMKSDGAKRNEPAFVVEVAKKIAEIKNLSFEKVSSQTIKNTSTLFGI